MVSRTVNPDRFVAVEIQELETLTNTFDKGICPIRGMVLGLIGADDAETTAMGGTGKFMKLEHHAVPVRLTVRVDWMTTPIHLKLSPIGFSWLPTTELLVQNATNLYGSGFDRLSMSIYRL